MESIKLTKGMAERCVTVLRVIATGMNAWRKTRGSDDRRRKSTAAAEGAHQDYDRCPEIKGLPTERNKVSQSRWRPACSNVIGYGSVGVRCSSHTDPMPDFFLAPLPSFPCFRGGKASGYRQLEKESDTETRGRRRLWRWVDFRNYETPLAPGDPSVGGEARGAARPRQCHFNYAC